jgi:hypothetical protein
MILGSVFVFKNLVFIVELNCKIKIWDKLKTKENLFCYGGGYPLLRAGKGGKVGGQSDKWFRSSAGLCAGTTCKN